MTVEDHLRALEATSCGRCSCLLPCPLWQGAPSSLSMENQGNAGGTAEEHRAHSDREGRCVSSGQRHRTGKDHLRALEAASCGRCSCLLPCPLWQGAPSSLSMVNHGNASGTAGEHRAHSDGEARCWSSGQCQGTDEEHCGHADDAGRRTLYKKHESQTSGSAANFGGNKLWQMLLLAALPTLAGSAQQLEHLRKRTVCIQAVEYALACCPAHVGRERPAA